MLNTFSKSKKSTYYPMLKWFILIAYTISYRKATFVFDKKKTLTPDSIFLYIYKK